MYASWGMPMGGRNILKHSSNPLGSLFVPFAFGLDWTGFSNIIDCLSKKYWRCIGATLGLWKGFQARSYMYTCERKAFPESKTLCLSWKGSELGPEPLFMKVCYFPSPSPWIQLKRLVEKGISDYFGCFCFLLHISWIFACELHFSGTTLLCNFFSLACSSFLRNNVCIKVSVFQAASFVYAAFIVWSNKRILVYLRVFELPFYLARTGTDLLFSWNRIVT